MNDNYNYVKSFYDKKLQFFGSGQFYQDFPTLGFPGTRDCNLRIEKYQAKEFIKPDDIILDIGCNTGFLSMELAKHAKYVDGFDCETELIETANAAKEVAKIENCNFFVQNFNYLEITENKYDVLLCLAIFEWLIKEIGMEKFIDQVERITNPGARIFYESHRMEEDIQVNADRLQIEAFEARGFRVLHTSVFTDDFQRKITVLEKA